MGSTELAATAKPLKHYSYENVESADVTGSIETQTAGTAFKKGGLLRDYCISITSSSDTQKAGNNRFHRPSECVSLLTRVRFAQAGETGQAGRGGDGGSADGALGGRGGEAGQTGGRRSLEKNQTDALTNFNENEVELRAYCTEVLKARVALPSAFGFTSADCAYYYLTIERQSAGKRSGKPSKAASGSSGPSRGPDGPDGASIDGGIGGQGGRGGSGPAGGRGGAGGVGVGGGIGGGGGAGGFGQ